MNKKNLKSDFEGKALNLRKDKEIDFSKREKFGVEQKKIIVFFNSIGGLGDTFLIPMVIKYYKSRFPNDICILYDSIYFSQFYNRPTYIDYIVKAKRPLLPNYAVKWFKGMDETLSDEGAVDINDLRFDFIVNTHVAHDRNVHPEEKVLSIDFANATNRVINSPDFEFLDFQLKPEHSDLIDAYLGRARQSGRILVGIQNRSKDPYRNHVLEGKNYVEELRALGSLYSDLVDAKVFFLGDADITLPWRQVAGDWFNLDTVKNIYFKLEVFRRLDLIVGAVSGFSHITNLQRRPWQVPLVYAFPAMDRLKGDSLTDYYKKYRELGGGVELGETFLYHRSPLFKDFYRQPHKNAREIFDFSLNLLRSFNVLGPSGFQGPAKPSSL